MRFFMRLAGSLLMLILMTSACNEASSDPVIVTSFPQPTDDQLSAFANQVLADGFVSVSEMEQSYENYVSCLADGGASGRYSKDFNTLEGSASMWMDGDDPEGTQLDALSIACRLEHLESVEQLFSPPGAGPSEDIIGERLLVCLSEAFPELIADLGVDPGPDDVRGVLDNALFNLTSTDATREAARDCEQASLTGPWVHFGD